MDVTAKSVGRKFVCLSRYSRVVMDGCIDQVAAKSCLSFFMSLSFAFVFLLSWALFNEPLTWQKVAGVILIGCGVVLSSQG